MVILSSFGGGSLKGRLTVYFVFPPKGDRKPKYRRLKDRLHDSQLTNHNSNKGSYTKALILVYIVQIPQQVKNKS